jgi:endoglucanase
MRWHFSSLRIRLARLVIWAIFVTGCMSTPTPAPTPTIIPSPTPEPPVDAFTMNARLARSVNLGNALEAPNEGDWGVTLQAEYFQLIREKGFTAVRLPVRWSAHAMTEAPYTIDSQFFARVDWAVEQALSNDLAIVLDMHHYEEMATDPTGHQERFLSLWRQIAEHYQNQPNAVLFELLNEPNGVLHTGYWNKLIAEVLPVIRATNPTRNIIIGPAEWNNAQALDDLVLPADDQHLIVTFHFYSPFEFTHQGAEWLQASGSDNWLGTEWTGTSAEKQVLQHTLNLTEQWATQNQRPIFLGEFGAYSKAPLGSRVTWTSFIAREAEARNFSWSYWEFCSGFGVYDPVAKQWNEDLVKALIP